MGIFSVKFLYSATSKMSASNDDVRSGNHRSGIPSFLSKDPRHRILRSSGHLVILQPSHLKNFVHMFADLSANYDIHIFFRQQHFSIISAVIVVFPCFIPQSYSFGKCTCEVQIP